MCYIPNFIFLTNAILFPKVIAHNLNVERVKTLKKRLSEGINNLESLQREFEGDINGLDIVYKEAVEKLEEVNSIKRFTGGKTFRS